MFLLKMPNLGVVNYSEGFNAQQTVWGPKHLKPVAISCMC